jgi:hypothetical protein
MSKELGIVIPIVGPTANFQEFLHDLSYVLIRNSIEARIVVVANSEELHLRREEYQILQSENLLDLTCFTSDVDGNGYGRLIRLGIAQLNNKSILIALPDGTAELELVPKLINSVRQGADLAIVNRYSQENSKGTPIFQRIFSYSLNWLLPGKLPQDSTYAFRMFDKALYESLAVSGTSWDFFAEQSVKTILCKGAITSIDGKFRQSNDSSLRFKLLPDGFGYVRVLVRTLFHRLGIPWF